MEVGILENDHLLDVLRVPQLYMFEIWIETINLDKSKIKVQENALSKTNKSATTFKSGGTDGESESSEDYKRGSKNKSAIGREDFLLPNGLKPLRVRFNLFDMKQVNILPIEFDILLLIESYADSSSESDQSSDNTKSVNENSANNDEKENAGETSKTSNNDNSNKNYSKTAKATHPKIRFNKAAAETSSKSPSNPALNKTDGKSGKTDHGFDDVSKTSLVSSYHYLFHLDEVLKLLDEDMFIPKSETNMRRGGSATFAMPPFNMIQSLQRGKIILTVDRFGGRIDDEGDVQGEATITLPQTWIESVLKVANQPSLAPIKFNVTDNIPIFQSGTEVGRMEFIMRFHCLAGCIASGTMPSQLGLYISVVDSNNKAFCHKPIVRKKITYESMMKKSLDDDYDMIYKPSCTKSLRPRY